MRPILLNSCAKAATAAETRFRIDVPIAGQRAARIVALDERAAVVVRRVAEQHWSGARFFTCVDQRPQLNGSRESTAALWLAAALAERDGAKLTLVGVVEMRFDLAGFARPADPEEIARLERALQRARASLHPGLAVESKEVHGVVPDVIFAAARGANLLAIGSRGNYSPVRRLFLGSVAAKVARTAPCPTLIVPAV